MLTKEQHIEYWINTAAEDWISVEVLFDSKRYLHCLFWSHLALEKLAKAHWVKTHADDIPQGYIMSSGFWMSREWIWERKICSF